MREPKHEQQALSQAGAELLDAWVQSRQLTPEFAQPDVSTLVRYQSGALSPEEIRAVEAALVRYPTGRELLKNTRSELQGLRVLPWSEVDRIAHVDTLT